eukprot:403375884
MISLENSCNINCALQCTDTRSHTLEEIDGCLQICRCLSDFQYQYMINKPKDAITGKYLVTDANQLKDRPLNDLEQGEINYICIDHCIDYKSLAKQCFSNCESTLTRLMLNGQYDELLATDFKINEQNTEGIVFMVIFYIVGGIILGATMFMVCKAIKKSVRHRNQKKKAKKDKKRNKMNRKRFASGQHEEESGDFLAYNDRNAQLQPFLPKVSVHSLDA